jgi:hypothetical protein
MRLLVLALCLFTVASGVAVQWKQGGQWKPGAQGEAVLIDTPFHSTHRVAAHVLVAATWMAVLASLPMTIAGIAVTRRWWWLTHPPLSLLTLGLLLLSGLTGYLGRPPVTQVSYFRFRVLHTILVPTLGVLSLLAWMWAARSYRRAVAAERTHGE